MTPGPVAAWSFDEGAGTEAHDATGAGNDATLTGQTWVTGKYGNALQFGVSPLRVEPSTSLDLSQAMTLSAWVLPDEQLEASPIVLQKGWQPAYFLTPGDWWSADTGFRTADYEWFTAEAPRGVGAKPGAWTHVAGTYDGSIVRLYLNGEVVGEQEASALIPSVDGALMIGGVDDNAETLFPGRLDEIRIYNRALSAVEIASDMATPVTAGATADTAPPEVALLEPASGATVSGLVTLSAEADDLSGIRSVRFLVDGAPFGAALTSPPYERAWHANSAAAGPHTFEAEATDIAGNTQLSASVTVSVPEASSSLGLVLALGFDEGEGDQTHDATGAGHDAVLSGQAWAAGKFGSSLEFSGQLLEVTESDLLDLNDTLTLSAWVLPRPGNSRRSAVLLKQNWWSFSYGLYGGNEERGPAILMLGDEWGLADVVAPTTISAWSHIAATSDGNELKLYVNGQLAESEEFVAGLLNQVNGPLHVGGDIIDSDAAFIGRIDELRVYNRALTASEIAADMEKPVTAGAGVETTPPVVSLSAPTNGAAVSGLVSLVADTSDENGVQQVEFLIDGTTLGIDRAAPFTERWLASAAAAGTHELLARATDFAGNVGVSAALTVTVASSASHPGLVAAWGFDEGSGTETHDATGAGHDATLTGQTWVAGKYGNALQFGSDYLTVESSAWLDLSQAMTLSAWVLPDEELEASPIVLQKGWQSAYFLTPGSWWSAAGGFRAENYDWFTAYAPRDVKAKPEAWTHVAVTYEGSNVRLYLNGEVVGEAEASAPISVVDGALMIGGTEIEDSFFPGRLDEIRIYDRALSATDIASDMATPITDGATADTTPPTLTLIAPTGGAVAGLVTLSATADDESGIRGVEFEMDGKPLGAPLTAPPYTLPWHARSASPGDHELRVLATDRAGNVASSDVVTLVVDQADSVPGLVLAFGFDEGSGDQTHDASGAGHDAPLAGQTWTTGKFGSALEFDGQLLTIPSPYLLDLTPGMTLSAWVMRQPDLFSWSTLLMRQRDDERSYFLYTGSSDRPPEICIEGAGSICIGGQTPPPPSLWTHIAATYDAQQLRLYVNGEIEATLEEAPTSLPQVGGSLYLGGNLSWSEELFRGRLDELRIYNRSLSQAEILADMITPITDGALPDGTPPAVSLSEPANGASVSGIAQLAASASDDSGVRSVEFLVDGVPLGPAVLSAPFTKEWHTAFSPPGSHELTARATDHAGNVGLSAPVTVSVVASPPATGLVAAFGFDEGDGASTADASGKGHDTTLSGQAWAQGKYGSALEFNGPYLTVSDSDFLDLTTQMTISAWVMPTGPLVAYPTIVAKEGEDDISYVLYANTEGPGGPGVFFKVESGWAWASGEQPPALNVWTHLATTYDGEMLRMYVNGEVVDETATDVPMATSSAPLRMGANSFYSNEIFHGRIDEVRIYAHALSQVELEADMARPVNAAPTQDTTPPVVSLTAPAAGASVQGIVPLHAEATDASGVASVRFFVDGAQLGSPVTSTPYEASWPTAGLTVGSHTLRAEATDSAGNSASSSTVTVSVTTTPTCNPATVSDGNPCTTDACSGSTAVFTPLAAGTSCSNGNRCDGAEACDASGSCQPGTPPSTDATCDGIDDDCDGQVDEDYIGAPTSCGVGICARNGTMICQNGAVVDGCSPGTPAANDAICNQNDDDCDGQVDEDFVSTPSSCGVGACAATGQTRCIGGHLTNDCTPRAAAADDRSCNGQDDDCDGQTDEEYLAVASTCGVGACVASGSKTCEGGAVRDSCAAAPAASSDANCNGIDDDCNGQIDEDFVPATSSCGVGACARQGTRTCQAGGLVDSCSPAAALASSDTSCNGIDDDCDGETDEDFAALPISCGVGACTAGGTRGCHDGALHDTCTPLTSPGSDDNCNGVDDDCDGSTDEAFVASPTTCGQGACQQQGVTSCLAGHVLDSCSAGAQGGLDTSCDGVDADCDGQVDEEYVPHATSCGVGACARTGVSSCQNGVQLAGCTAGQPLVTRDESCDGVDQDCDGQVDEDFALTATQCGVGACHAVGQWTCVAGEVTNSCSAGPAASDDTTCDGIDDDCDGTVDEDFVGNAVACGVGACHATGAQICSNGAVVAQCTPGIAAPSDATCNGTDDDCDGAVDEDYSPPATTCGLGACQASGVLRCTGGQAISDCAPRQPSAADATCNGVDDDCDGSVDEDYAPTAIQCGVGACKADGSRRCQAGAETDDCSPQPAALSDDTCDGVDNDCDGAIDEDYIATPTSCGVGACANSGQTRCTAGALADTCNPRSAAADDASCNGVDDDCNGAIDEDYLPLPTTCGAGACSSTGGTSCVAGHVVDSCEGTGGTTADQLCNGLDDDCDGSVDEDYAPVSVSCGVGACAAVGTTACSSGHVASQCSPGTPAAADATCDGIDEDCDGLIDEDYATETTQCGVGACHASGATACVAGGTQNSCRPGLPAPSDASCNGVDDDCDGAVDEDYQGLPTSCGVGACARSGVSTCTNGAVASTCQAGPPSASDSLCNGIDDDCDGSVDEEYAPRTTSCGVGACAAAGTTSCQLGTERDSCVAGPASASDDDCNGRDDDCNGSADEDFQPFPSQCGTGACARSGTKTCASGQVQDSCNAGSPSADDSNCNGIDDDCNGENDEDFVETSTNCGVGNCRAQGSARCQLGSVVDTCRALTAATTDDDCDGLDDDCDGSTDEEFEAHVTSCGVGVCRAEGVITCEAGQVHDSCSAAPATGPDTNCNGLDEDCDGAADQNYAGTSINCGIGACRTSGSTICGNGAVVSVCTPLSPSGADDNCNGIDENCNGSADEGYGVRCNGAAAERCSQGAIQLTQCVDQNLCNGEETCSAGACRAGLAPAVDDHDPCTTDACDALLGVSHQAAPRGTACGPGRACDGAGGCDSLPVIAQGPQSLTVDLGQPLTLAVSATGTGLSYQWRRTGQEILGATQATYVLQAATAAESGVEFSVTVSNTAGSVTSTAAIVTVRDAVGPQLDVDGPSSRTVSTDTITIAGSAHDPDSQVASVVVGSDRYPSEFAALLNTATGAFAAEVPLKLGDNLLSVRARDAQGNVSTRTLVVTLAIDLLPRIQITEPVANALSATELVTVRGIVRSTFKADEVRLVMGSDVRFPSGEDGEYTFEFTGVRLQRGPNLLTVRAETRGGSSSAQVSVNYGVPPSQAGAAPVIRLVGAQAESFTSANQQLISGIVTATRCVSSVSVNDVAVPTKGSGSQVSFDYLQALQPGDSSVAISVKALDCDGRSAELNYTILHDDVAPSFSLALTPAPAEHRFSQTPVTVSGTITEGHLAGLSTNQQSLSVLPGANGQWDFNVAIPLSRAAAQTITFEAWDRAGNRASYTVKLGLDAAFDVEVLTPTPGSEVVALESSTSVDVVARVVGLPADQYVTAAVDSLPGVQLTRGSGVFSGQLSVSGLTSKHTLSVVARRADGSALAQKVVPFSIKAASDIPLEVTFANPLNGRQNVEANQPVVLSFNRPVALSELSVSVEETAHGKQYKPLEAAASFTEFNNVQLIDVHRDHAAVVGGLSLLPGGQAIIFYPTRDYAYGGTVTVTVKQQDKEVGRASFDVRPLPTLLSGLVMDQSQTALQGITVSLPDLGVSTVTDENGLFSFGFGTFDKVIPAGRHRLVVNPSLAWANYGNLIRYADTQLGRRVDLGVLTTRLLDRSEPLRHIGSGGAPVSFLSGAAVLDLSHAELLFPDGRAQGNVQAEVVWGPNLGFHWPPFAQPFVSLVFQPMGVEVAGSVGLDFALPPHPAGQDYAASLPDRALVVGVDTRSLELAPVGVVRLERETGRYESEGPLLLTRLDVIALAPIPDPGFQELLRGYGAGEMTLTALISKLGELP